MPPGIRIVALLALVTLLPTPTEQAIAQSLAPIMPLASRSLLLDIGFAGDRILVAGERGHILYSDDAGDHWQQARVPTTQMLTGIYFADATFGWAVGHDGVILASDNRGDSWRIQRDGLAVQQQMNLEQREHARQQLRQLEKSLHTADQKAPAEVELELEDARLELEDADLALAEPIFTSPLMDVWFQDKDRGWAVGAFGTLVTTVDGGHHWVNQPEQLENPDELHLNTITGDGKGRIFIAGEGGMMFRSLDSGLSWETLPSIYDGSWFGAVYSAKNDVLLVFGLRGKLFRSSDFGSNWQPVSTDNEITLAGGSANDLGEIVLAGGVGTVLHSTDGGTSFLRTMLEDHLSLSAGTGRAGRIILVGQGGIKIHASNQ